MRYCSGTGAQIELKMGMITQVQSRKERRKQERQKRKRHPSGRNDVPTEQETAPATEETPRKVKKTKLVKQKGKAVKASSKNKDVYDMESSTTAAIRRDDDEIADLESKLGIRSKKHKAKLKKEYARLEGYGDDFGDFLDDLDNLVSRVSGNSKKEEDHDDKGSDLDEGSDNDDDEDEDFDEEDPTLSAALERDEEEIAELEKKLGLSKKKDKAKLYKQYEAEGFGGDFGDFLDDLDGMMDRVSSKEGNDSVYQQTIRDMPGSDEDESDDTEEDDQNEEELVPMKGPTYDEMDEDDSVLEELERTDLEEEEDESSASSMDENDGEEEGEAPIGDDSGASSDGEKEPDVTVGTDSGTSSDGDSENDDSGREEADHDISDTYRPSRGQDIYGKSLDADSTATDKPRSYVPPHLRRKQGESESNEELLRNIRRALNNSLNRLSEDTLISVAQQVAKTYSSFPTQSTNEVLWVLIKNGCILPSMLMTGLIPVFMACLVGVHIQTGDTVQISEFILETAVSELWKELAAFRKRGSDDTVEDEVPAEVASKRICNRMLVLCYLYNYNVVHCSFMYDVIRHLIDEFSEVDIECLLLLLGHCGQSLRSDDPLALKEIVLLVQKKKATGSDHGTSSRSEYMVSAITDLKNNRRGKQDSVYIDKTSKMKKQIGRIKSLAAKSNKAKTTTESSLRISLSDILNAETKGRWWKVGASWVGNQYSFKGEDESADDKAGQTAAKAKSTTENEENEALLKLASKYRMNTDRKRSIFCIVMGSEDCDDAFEKLCRGSMLQNRSERDACRVLLECCGNEKAYNKFYGHLAERMCEYQPQCKFSFQLAFWDLFKQFETIDARKAANLAKFLYHLVLTHNMLRLMAVLKALDINEEDMEESAIIFLTILLSAVLDHFGDAAPVKELFANRIAENEDPSKQEQEEGIRASLLVFMMETLKASPKNKKGSQFRKNLKAAIKALDSDGLEDMF